jgi:hypothetical protein
MSATRPPLAAMITATRSSAGMNVDFPTVPDSRSACRPAIPAGSRVRPISAAIRLGQVVSSSQAIPGRITSPLISWARPVPSPWCSSPPREPSRPAAFSSASIRQRQSAATSASVPVAAQRSCQVVPGCSSSQSRTFSTVSFRQCRTLTLSTTNGGASSRRATANRSASVAGQDAGTGRAGNPASSALASALSCRGGAATSARVSAAVTSGLSRTARPGSRPGSPAPAPAGPDGPRTCGDGGPAWPRRRPRPSARRKFAWT